MTTTKRNGRAIFAVLAVVVLIGLGVMTITTSATYDGPNNATITLDCGSAFTPATPKVTDAVSWDQSSIPNTPELRAHFADTCKSATDTRKAIGWGLVVIGLVGMAVAGYRRVQRRRVPNEVPNSDAPTSTGT